MLGAFIAALMVVSASGRRPLDLAALTDGVYPPEPTGIWTDGYARLDLTGPCTLEITLGGTLPFPNLRSAKTRRAG